MPNFFTHYLCGNAVLECSENEEKTLLLRNRRVFNLGTQGPDILFYYRFWPWTKSHGIDIIGERMHQENVKACFAGSLKYICALSGQEKELLSAFLCGYACHYALDLTAHPYIFYRSGFVRCGEAPDSRFTGYHRMFETAVDVLMLQRLAAKGPYEVNAPELIGISGEEINTVSRMLSFVLAEVYGESVDIALISTAVKDMINAQTIFRSRTGLRKKILAALEKSLSRPALISGMIHPPVLTDGLDYLNLKHQPWALPWDQTKQRTDSFPELFNEAVREACLLSGAILRWTAGREDSRRVLDLIGNRSFSTGIDCENKTEFSFYDCIFE